MKKLAALQKLAQVRLAINYILRNRMTKQALNQTVDIVNPGDPDYEPLRGITEPNRTDFLPYDRLNPPPLLDERYPLRKGVYNLTPKEVTNPKVNPFIKYPEGLHERLFGVPTFRDSYWTDRAIIPGNTSLIYDYGSVAPKYFDRTVLQPLVNQANKDLFPDRKQIFKFGVEKDPEFNGVMDDYNSFWGYNAIMDTPFGRIPIQIPGYISELEMLSRDDTKDIDSMDVSAYDESGGHGFVPWPVSNKAKESMGMAYDARMHKYDLQSAALDAENRYSNNTNEFMNSSDYVRHHSNLMHSYINKSPVGKAFSAYPSFATGIPYAIYHAMPYMWRGNREPKTNEMIDTIQKKIPKKYQPIYQKLINR